LRRDGDSDAERRYQKQRKSHGEPFSWRCRDDPASGFQC
jgi:hypothetical protein